MQKHSPPEQELPNPLNNGPVTAKNASFMSRIIGHHNSHWWALAVTSILLVGLLLVWAIGSWQYKQITVGTTKISKAEINSKLEATLKDQLSSYQINIAGLKDDNQTISYKLSEAGITVDIPASIEATNNDANYWRSRLLWWQPRTANLVLKTDQSKFINFVNTKTRIVTKPVKNASLSVNPEGIVLVTKESKGIEKSLGNGQTEIRRAVKDLDSSVLKLTDQEIQPTITTKTLKTSQDLLEKTLAKTVTFSIEDSTIKPTPHDIAAWLVISPNEEKKSYNISVDKTKLTDYINGQAARYISRPVNQVEVIRPDGSKSVLITGQNGSDITNIDSVIRAVQDQLLKNESIQQDLKVSYTPFKTVSTPAGDRLIEVDTTNKVMYAYQNNLLLKTMYISAGAAGTPTVNGTFAIYSKLRSQNMTGFNADGSTYYQPNVPYVNYFYRDYAIHGNYWRPASYFGNINSSHGCVGIQDADAEWIYNWAPIGTPVIVHS